MDRLFARFLGIIALFALAGCLDEEIDPPSPEVASLRESREIWVTHALRHIPPVRVELTSEKFNPAKSDGFSKFQTVAYSYPHTLPNLEIKIHPASTQFEKSTDIGWKLNIEEPIERGKHIILYRTETLLDEEEGEHNILAWDRKEGKAEITYAMLPMEPVPIDEGYASIRVVNISHSLAREYADGVDVYYQKYRADVPPLSDIDNMHLIGKELKLGGYSPVEADGHAYVEPGQYFLFAKSGAEENFEPKDNLGHVFIEKNKSYLIMITDDETSLSGKKHLQLVEERFK